MFGGDLVPPARCPKITSKGQAQDILAPGLLPGSYGHHGRNPNTDYKTRMFHYQQRKDAFEQLRAEEARKQSKEDATYMKYEKHANKKRFQRCIEDKVQEKWKAYEDSVEARRRKLHEMICKEEREFYYETIDSAQRGADRKMEEMKLRAQMLKANREEERLKIVHQKRIEQYQKRCQELRPKMAQKHLMESKYTQLQQMRENEARREADRELDKMWYHLAVKETEAKKERETQEMLKRREKEKEMTETWDKQVKGRELLQQEINRIAKEDRLEMQKLSDQLRHEQIEALNQKQQQRNHAAQEILHQIEIQKQLQSQRKKEEDALDQAFSTLTQMEIDREKTSMQEETINAKKETAMYRKHLQKLDEERKLEEQKLMELLEEHRKAIEAKQDEAKCKIVEAKRKLQKDVMSERAEQIKYKKQEAEEQLKLKEAENELLRMAYETNGRLQAESDRLEYQAVVQYREDLQRQIEYNNVLRRREKEELERQLAEGLKEEEKYRKIVEQMLSGEIEVGRKHPFRRALERPDCYCPTKNK
ncbi:unnamed protein product [Ceutorhynchus assimilis]|uniref:Trichohyalin-plectin-homology domain-containing protein n=1 Tax=Ceutorhynchus assimilis TaxID=467358 RepID=A0A9N9MM85_9CUCU|nr:unnamed protein product [Ceutorhynchus assimilis]